MATDGKTSGAGSAPAVSVRGDARGQSLRQLPDEVPVAIVCNGTTQAVMMATPADLEDFVQGFALTEGLADSATQIEQIEIVTHEAGIEARLWLPEDRAAILAQRRRAMTGPVGCGLCGIDSLAQALRPLRPLPPRGWDLPDALIAGATDLLRQHQPLHDLTRAVHAAGFLLPGGRGLVLAREDVGRHNALDKLIGAMTRQGIDAAQGAIVLTSRVSIEMVQKTVMARCPVLIAVSAPTLRALDVARENGLTVAAFARAGGFDLFTPDQSPADDGASDVA